MKGLYKTLYGTQVEVTELRKDKRGNIVIGHTETGNSVYMSEKEFNKLFTKIEKK
jgi:hypothetical protein